MESGVKGEGIRPPPGTKDFGEVLWKGPGVVECDEVLSQSLGSQMDRQEKVLHGDRVGSVFGHGDRGVTVSRISGRWS